MGNLHLEFAYPWAPWLFLLLIPAVLLTLIPYFRLNKKYRKTRNRITSMVLHLLIMTLAVTVLTGVTFVYEVGNPDNELILLVDVSETEHNAQDRRDEVVEEILRESAYDGLKVGVVTFGFTQVYAVPLTYDAETAYETYLSATLPDTGATDIAAALRFTRTLFSNPETSKIVLVTDGKETDEEAVSAIGSLASQGTKVDAVHISSAFGRDNVQVTGIAFPEYHVDVGDTCEIRVSLRCKKAADAGVIELYDNGQIDPELTKTQPLTAGEQTVVFEKTLETEGLHEIRVKASESSDSLHENDEYVAYYYLQSFNHVLIIEQQAQSAEIEELLAGSEKEYEVDVLNLKTGVIPTTVDELRAYDQIILNNISNEDLTSVGLDELLNSYVYDYGGGLFTTGGTEADGETAHAYNRVDMYKSLYQQMLPVQAIDYTPPLGVVVIVDTSGSMGGAGENTPLYWAKRGAIGLLEPNVLSSRDFIGVLTLDDTYGTVLPLTARTRETVIRQAINGIDGNGGTVYTAAIQRAGQMLVGQKGIARRHIILISDGAPGDSERDYLAAVENNYANGVTISYIGVGLEEGSDAANAMQKITDAGHGRMHYIDTGSLDSFIDEMRDDVMVPEIKEVSDEPFNPRIADVLSPLMNGVEYSKITDEDGTPMVNAFSAQLKGFNGTQARQGVDVVLTGEYGVPIYAQWKYGAGTVGSFMSDLYGDWSAEFLADENAQRFLRNVIANLMPTENIRPNEISAKLEGENYINSLDIYTPLAEGETVRAELKEISSGTVWSLGEVTDLSAGEQDVYVTLALSEANRYSRSTFVVKRKGVYLITINKYNAENELIATYDMYKTFSYSLEYDQVLDETEQTEFLGTLAERGRGKMIGEGDDIVQVFEDFVTSVERTFDPRWLFMGLAMALFLLDIAVRKFKFKWPHEIVRDMKEKRAQRAGKGGKK